MKRRNKRVEVWQHMTDVELAYRSKNIGEWWLTFTRFFRPWIYELTERYKARGEYPLSAVTLLPSYYKDKYDVEIAALAGILLSDSKHKFLERVSEMRQLLGVSPFQWFRSRSFVALSIGEKQLLKTGGVTNARIAEFFSIIYDAWKERKEKIAGILLDYFGEDKYLFRLDSLLLVLATSDGWGTGVWDDYPYPLKPPVTPIVKRFYHTFFPDYLRYNDFDGAVHLFGFEHDYDFFYASLAYEELKKLKPHACSRLATIFHKRYKEVRMPIYREWVPHKPHGILPKIDDK